MKIVSRLVLPLLAIVSLLAFPAMLFAQDGASILSRTFDTAGVVAVLGAVVGVCVALSKFLPGYATKLNVVVAAAAAVVGCRAGRRGLWPLWRRRRLLPSDV